MKKFKTFIIICLLVKTLPLIGEEFFIEQHDYTVFIPEGWQTFDSSNLSSLSFRSDDESVVFQINTYPGDRFSSSSDMFEQLTDSFRIESDGSAFYYNEADSFLADISFDEGGNRFRGWFLFINREDRDYYLLAFSSEDYYEEKLPFILSCLDSFRVESDQSTLKPGAVSQFYYPFPGKNNVMAQMILQGQLVSFQTDIEEFEASQAVIEREAKLMKYYQDLGDKPLFEEAWKRYYKIIYRDNYSRFASLAETLEKSDIGTGPKEKAAVLLDWIQNFKYESSGTFSDLLSPIEAVAHEKGDCDARGLAYSIMLSHLGIDSILLVSWQYKHSISAVDVEGEGARYPLEGRTYLVAETTEVVGLGMIPQSMAEGEKWIPVNFFGP